MGDILGVITSDWLIDIIDKCNSLVYLLNSFFFSLINWSQTFTWVNIVTNVAEVNIFWLQNEFCYAVNSSWADGSVADRLHGYFKMSASLGNKEMIVFRDKWDQRQTTIKRFSFRAEEFFKLSAKSFENGYIL